MHTVSFLDVVALVLIQDEKVLVAQRSENDRLAFKWEFPGGKIEANESPEAALRREIQEELGLDIEVTAHFMTTEYNRSPVPIRLHTYLALLKRGEPESKVHHQIQWVPIQNLEELDFAPADLPIVQEVLKYQKINQCT